MTRKPNSKIANRYVSYVDQPFKNTINWLECKQNDDGAEGLWRIHDDLYDLTDFVDKHPGGKSWITLSKGTDITEAYETHHLDMDKTNIISRKYHVRKASVERNVKLTFAEDGFYQTLKRRVVKHLKNLPKSKQHKTNFIADGLLLSLFVLSIGATTYPLLVPLAGLVMTFLGITGHNYLHRRDNFRMFYFNMSFLNFKEWRVSHALSHHLFTNSLIDIELQGMQPMLCYLPSKDAKRALSRNVAWMLGPLIYATFFIMELIKRPIVRYMYKKSIVEIPDAIPFSLPLVMYVLGSADLGQTLLLWMGIVCFGSFVFSVNGINAGHHHPEVFHDGDETRENLDWGAFQMDTMIDREEILGNHFWALTNFGDHIIHHLFPTLDHGYLNDLYPILYETAHEFGLEVRAKSFASLIVGQHQQLFRLEPSSRLAEQNN